MSHIYSTVFHLIRNICTHVFPPNLEARMGTWGRMETG